MSLFNIRLDTTERLLYLSFGLTILVTAALITGLFILRSQNANQTEILNDTLDKINQQAVDIEKLSRENKELNQRNISYAYCNSVIVATYTQTLRPIEIKDLEKCLLESQSNEGIQAGQPQSPATGSQNAPQGGSGGNGGGAVPTPSPSPPSPEPPPEDCTIDILGICL